MTPTNLPFEEREWRIPAQTYSEWMELYARYARFDDDTQFVAEACSRFGRRPFTLYRIVIDDWRPRHE